MHEVEIGGDVGPQHHEALHCLHLLSIKVPIERWCLVGGLMVILAGRLAGKPGDRAERTKDADIVIDVVAHRRALATAYRELTSMGYRPPPEAWTDQDVARCTVVSGRAQLDLLAPDDATPDQLHVGTDIRSVAMPGGRRALEVAEPVRILYGDTGIAEVRVPTLYGAIGVKALACLDRRTQDQSRHIQDVAYLLSAVADPIDIQERLGPDAEVVRALAPACVTTKTWRGLTRERWTVAMP